MAPTSIAELEQCIAEFIGTEIGQPPEELDLDLNFGAFGLSSRSAVSLIGLLEDSLGVELSPVMVFEHETIQKLALAVGQRVGLSLVA